MKGINLLFQNYNSTIMTFIGFIIMAGMVIIFLILIVYLSRCFKKINHNLYYQKELLHIFSANVNNIFMIYDTVSHKFEYISKNFKELMEIDRSIIKKDYMKILDYIPAESSNKIIDFIRNFNERNILEEDFEYIKPLTKNKCWYLLRINRVTVKRKKEQLIISTSDITREKQIQKALEEALCNLQIANEAKKLFLSHISHELKTPINGILGMVQIAFNSLEDKNKTENCLNKINYSSRKLLTIINNILDISKIDSNKLVLTYEPFHISEILTSFSSIMNSQAELNCQEYSFSMNNIVDDSLLGDSLRLIQILENCVSNSIKFTPKGGKIGLEVTELERHADKALFSFVISDTGKGMSEAYLKHLFEPFEQEDYSISLKYGGTGIGMTIVKDLIDLMGGNIHVDSKVNRGTTITIHIVFRININTTKQEEPKNLRDQNVRYDCMGKRVLIVEDNEINQEITCELLKNINMKVETASNGYEAIKLFVNSKKGYYDVILMDLQMPELDGYQTAKAIRNSLHPDSQTICIIAMTADDFSEDQLSYESGMNYHFTKSINVENIYNIIQNVIKQEVS